METWKRHICSIIGVALLSLFVFGGCTTSQSLDKAMPAQSPSPIEETEVEALPFQASQKIQLLDTSQDPIAPKASPVGFHYQEEQPKKAIEPAVVQKSVVSSAPAKAMEPEVVQERVISSSPGKAVEPAVVQDSVISSSPGKAIEPAVVQDSVASLPSKAVETPVIKKDAPPSVYPKENALVVSAIGSGLTESEARNDALASLSAILYSQVSSFVETIQKETELAGVVIGNRSAFSEEIRVASDLPLLGVSSTILRTFYDPSRKAVMYEAEAMLKASTSLALYAGEMQSIEEKITGAEETLPKTLDSLAREEQLKLLLEYYTEFEKLGYVARALGAATIPSLRQSRYSLELLLLQEGRVIDSYKKAARSLSKAVSKDGVYVYPAKLNGTGGVTEFAEQLSYAIQSELGNKAVSSATRASYFLFGTYTLKAEGKEGIYVTYRVEDRDGNVVATSTAELLPLVYQGQQIVPIAYDFQKQLERGDSVDTDFSVDIRINGMKDYISFQGGDALTIEVKAGSPCYFYVVGYVFNELNETFSYLFPLKLDAVGKDMFVYRVSPEDVNKWIIINPTYRGEVLPIEVVEPYGVEMLQVYASTEKEYQKFMETVPGFKETRDYYLISNNPEDGLALTRALNVKKKSDLILNETRHTEASVAFTSSRKR